MKSARRSGAAAVRGAWHRQLGAALLALSAGSCHRRPSPDVATEFYGKLATACSKRIAPCQLSASELVPGDWDTLWIGNGVYDTMIAELDEVAEGDRAKLISSCSDDLKSYNLVMATRGGHLVWSEWCEADSDSDVSCVHAGETLFHAWLRIPRSASVRVDPLLAHDLRVTVVHEE